MLSPTFFLFLGVALTLCGRSAFVLARPDLSPTTLEIDLVFPRAGAIHRRTYPFPVIFAIQGAREVWPWHLRLDFVMFVSGQFFGPPGSTQDMDLQWALPDLETTYTQGEIKVQPGLVEGEKDVFYVVGMSNSMLDSNATTEFSLSWTARLPDNCTEMVEVAPAGTELEGAAPRFNTQNGEVPEIHGLIEFKVENDAPIEIAMADGQCVEARENNTLRIGGTTTDQKCIFFDDDDLRPEGNPCAARVDSALAEKVTQRAYEYLGCAPEGAWPGDEPKRWSCPLPDSAPDDSGAGKLGVAISLVLGLGAAFGSLLFIT